MLAILGIILGTVGSIATAFSIGKTLQAMNLAVAAVRVTVSDLATNKRDTRIIEGTDKHLQRAASRDAKVLWFGIVLLVLGFACQTASAVQGWKGF